MNAFLRKQSPWLLPIMGMLIITPFTPALDLAFSNHFYKASSGFTNNAFFTFMFYYGPIPAILTFAVSVVLLVLSFVMPKFIKWRRPALCLTLTFIIGSGLFTHAIFKDHWGRPRPKQIVQFGGKHQFRPYYQPNFFHGSDKLKSLPSGHATMGFYFFSLMLVGCRIGNRPLFWGGLTLALAMGFMLSLTRIAQGGHFFSDVLMAALIMWLAAYWCDKAVYFYGERK